MLLFICVHFFFHDISTFQYIFHLLDERNLSSDVTMFRLLAVVLFVVFTSNFKPSVQVVLQSLF